MSNKGDENIFYRSYFYNITLKLCFHLVLVIEEMLRNVSSHT